MDRASPPTLIRALLQPERYDHAVACCQLIETHISWVILTGDYAYKIKKPVDLGFLDFSTLERRRFFCEEEIRLNRRLAPGIYLEVVSINGTAQDPVIDGEGNAIEYAVKMVQFAQETQLDRMLDNGVLEAKHMDAFAHLIADFHCKIEAATTQDDYGTPARVWQPMAENFSQIRERIDDTRYLEALAEVERWSRSAFVSLESLLAQRKTDGFIRECHGDMHLRNLAWIDDGPVAFDGIEFNPDLRWIDVISDIAFLVMDLQDHHQFALAQRFLNGYLELTGDYAGLKLLPLYLVYRAMVRAKVCAIGLVQGEPDEGSRVKLEAEFAHYLSLAQSYTRPISPGLLITRGLSGSGKTTHSQPLVEILPAIRIRSDVERKRLYGLSPLESGRAAPAAGIYRAEATARTYERLRELAALVLNAGYTVMVDATFLQHWQRELFECLARELGVGYGIVEFMASERTLRHRLRRRQGDASDADLAVLEHQLAGYEPLQVEERSRSVRIDTEAPFEVARVTQEIKALMSGGAGS